MANLRKINGGVDVQDSTRALDAIHVSTFLKRNVVRDTDGVTSGPTVGGCAGLFMAV